MKTDILSVVSEVAVMEIIISVLLLFLGLGALMVIHVCIVGRAFMRGFGSSNLVERGSLGSTSMSKSDIEKLPSFHFEGGDTMSSPVDCAVCLENFSDGDKCRLLPLCKHSFHADCVDLWLLKTPICPICRKTADTNSAGEENSCFSGTTSNLREGQNAESDHLIEFRENQTLEGGQLTHTITTEMSLHIAEVRVQSPSSSRNQTGCGQTKTNEVLDQRATKEEESLQHLCD